MKIFKFGCFNSFYWDNMCIEILFSYISDFNVVSEVAKELDSVNIMSKEKTKLKWKL